MNRPFDDLTLPTEPPDFRERALEDRIRSLERRIGELERSFERTSARWLADEPTTTGLG